METLINYIRKTTGFEVFDRKESLLPSMKLPLFINEAFKILPASINDKNVVFVFPKDEEEVTPGQLLKQVPVIENTFEAPAVIVFDFMSYYLKQQLIENRRAFIWIDEQLFIPFLAMNLKEYQKVSTTKVETFSPSTQCLLIYHMWIKSIAGKSFQELAEIFTYTPRTIGRAAKELEQVGICEIAGTKPKYLKFGHNPLGIWVHYKEYFSSPVSKRVWTILFDAFDKVKLSGINALAEYTHISGEKKNVFALSAGSFKELNNLGEVSITLENEDDTQLEIWNYDPVLLARDGVVDPISLYLSLQNNPDERVQIELNSMLGRLLN